jgi:Cupin superfamily protein
MTDHTATQAAQFFGMLWAALHLSGAADPPIPTHRHYPRAFDPAWLATLPLPLGQHKPADQRVALVDDSQFDRYHDPDQLHSAYARHARTRVYEGIHRTAPWIALVAEHLDRLTPDHPTVVATAYESTTGDATLRPHRDTWDGAIIQLTGTKQWHLGPGLLGHGPVETLTTGPGDILVIPDALPHDVATPPDPGHSRHLAFALRRRTPPPQEHTTPPPP